MSLRYLTAGETHGPQLTAIVERNVQSYKQQLESYE